MVGKVEVSPVFGSQLSREEILSEEVSQHVSCQCVVTGTDVTQERTAQGGAGFIRKAAGRG